MPLKNWGNSKEVANQISQEICTEIHVDIAKITTIDITEEIDKGIAGGIADFILKKKNKIVPKKNTERIAERKWKKNAWDTPKMISEETPVTTSAGFADEINFLDNCQVNAHWKCRSSL